MTDITGWKLVPDDPTEVMWQAGRSADIHPGDSYSKVWRAMFEAAPDVDDCETTNNRPRPIAEYHEDMGPVLWWALEMSKCTACSGDGYINQCANSPDVKCTACAGTGAISTGAWMGEPPYVGTPNDCGFTVHVETKIATSCTSNEKPRSMARRFDVGGWPGYHTHFTEIPIPEAP
jgi:hypothetical protein